VSSSAKQYDVVVAGGGHNGLVAAAYLSRAGLSVLVLERLGHVGGAAVSAQPFAGHEARLSRYSYLVSLMPEQLIADLDLDISLASRTTASYTPTLRDGKPGGLLVERPEGPATAASFETLTGGTAEYDAWRAFYSDVSELAHVVEPSLLSPLPTERQIRDQVEPAVWEDLVTNPLGAAIEKRFADDTVRGVVGTDALIGTFASLHDPSLIQNRAFLYHLIGNRTGEWRVPIGGMGAVTGALAAAASEAGAEIITSAGVSTINGGDDGAEVTWHDGTSSHTVSARFVLANVAPWVLRILMGEAEDAATKPQGAQLKINFLLNRLPRLKSGVDPAVAFAGTLHLGEDYTQLEAAYADAAAGRVPSVMPGEVYCHTLSDPSILGSADDGTHTLTYFGLHTPASLFEQDAADAKRLAVSRALASLNEHLVEPIETCVATDATGAPCIEAKIPQDVEADLAMPGGHIYHGDLDWP
jgi:phytoene dehydrogenase-like protein